jgi:pentapeptide MXKDX repeat protein
MKAVLITVIAASLAVGPALRAQDLGEASALTKPSSMAGTSMKGTSMKGTSMSGTSMKGTSMKGSSMKGSSMKGTSMSGTSMKGTSMKGFSMKASGEAKNTTSGYSAYAVRPIGESATNTAPGLAQTREGAASPTKSATCSSGPAASPTTPSVFILSTGGRVESRCYMLTVDSLRLQDGPEQRTIPLREVNVDATVAANRERGIDLKIPKNKAEIVLGF